MTHCPKCNKTSCGKCRLTPAVKNSIFADRSLTELKNDSGYEGGLSEWPKLFKGRHLEPGVVTYDQPDGSKKTYLLTREAIAKMRPTAEGKPIVGLAGDFDHKPVAPSDFMEGKADGVVVDGYDCGDGWDGIRFMVWEPETKARCAEGEYELSCAYVPTETDGKSGLWHNVPYDESILGGEFTHFAVVPNPRYVGASIEMVNSLKGGIKIVNKMLKALLQQTVGLKGLREIANSIEEDEKAEENAADEAAKKKAEELAKKNSMDKAKSDALYEEYVGQYDPTGSADVYEPQNISRWLSGKGLSQPDQNAVIGMWRHMLSGDNSASAKAKLNASGNAAEGTPCPKCGSKNTFNGVDTRAGGDSSKASLCLSCIDWGNMFAHEKLNAAPPDPALQGHSVVDKPRQPEPGTSMAAPKPGEEVPAKNDAGIPPAKPEPGQPAMPPQNAEPTAEEKAKAEADKAAAAAANTETPEAKAAREAAEAEAKKNAEPPADGKCQLCGEIPSKLELRDAGDAAGNKKMHVCADGTGCDNASEHKNSLKVFEARKSRRELLNKLRMLQNAQQKKKELFNSLKDSAEKRGGIVELENSVLSPAEKEKLGQQSYGKRD